ncbi:excisionase family DNA-binding protein [Erythrobacter litoralis]|uniref:excisionase family DNA-binding protein n=1 Tax=Erythrobacter litoralis TaxID=39960 RepID=UPI00004EB6DD|nr:excisionase family DNA-binding protein [Erythrobacter litoralis]
MDETPQQHGARIAFSVAETAEATGLGRTTIYSLIRDGKLRSVKAGNRRLIRACDVYGLVQV